MARYLFLLAIACVAVSGCQKDTPAPAPAPTITSFTPTAGIGSTGVVIDGTDFAELITENKVQFNGVEGVVTYASKKQLHVRAPVNYKTGKIGVKSNSSRIVLSTSDFTRHPAIVNIAGTDGPGFAEGPGANAKFSLPWGLIVDDKGIITVMDGNNNMVRKISSTGLVVTFSGRGGIGDVDGGPLIAQYRRLLYGAMDPGGNLFVSETEKATIRKISPTGSVAIFAGSFSAGYMDDVGTNARFKSPAGMAADRFGNIFVLDAGDNRIRTITPTGTVTTLAGNGNTGNADGPGLTATFRFVSTNAGMAIDKNGTLYVSDEENYSIRKIKPDGTVSTLAGGTFGYADGAGSAAQFRFPAAVAVDQAGNVYVGDQNRIRKITPEGEVTTYAGKQSSNYLDYGLEGDATTASMSKIGGLAVDTAGNLYLADGNFIRKIIP